MSELAVSPRGELLGPEDYFVLRVMMVSGRVAHHRRSTNPAERVKVWNGFFMGDEAVRAHPGFEFVDDSADVAGEN